MKKELALVIVMVFVVIISSGFVIYKLNATGQVVETSNLDVKENLKIGDIKKNTDENFLVEEVNKKQGGIQEEESEIGFVSKIIDGDTIIADGKSVRLLGIDADEKGYECYNKAKEWLEERILNKEVRLVQDGENKDQYDRYLRYVFVNDENINLKLVEEGLAIARLYSDNKKYREEILDAEKNAREDKQGCKWESYEGDSLEGNRLGEREYSELPEGVVGACNSGNYIGQEKIVEGEVVVVYKSGSDTVFLNFEKPYPNQCFSAVIFKGFLSAFPDYESYEGERVRVKGKIEEYNEKPEIILKEKEQIWVV